ncbi:TonB-dependent siderophore receptor [Pseudoduganella sp. FT25W]|uniref:TonB-dependent siderophore receptor n=1 Tax=Duganella alba TaxID=2666081 RepID=A0A6L5QA89_9BURK|nr:TonB-dependent siderophore receptor [Duganella alba]MRX06625.1 TonB-dependent siderophore receptor [Duganella alba]MRX18025.1 TonB-dependent siderophore receptor [Duganella alba]
MQNTNIPRATTLTLALQLAFAATAYAAEPVDTTLPSVTVTGQAAQDDYLVKRTSAGTKTDTAIRDLPQTVTVINQALIKDLSMQSMADVARYVPGIGMANGEGNRDAPIFRGSSNASGDFYIDGVRDDVEYYRDLYNVEQVEALTGPNAMIFGRGGSGGVINRVTKQANFGAPVRSADVTLGSYKNRRLTVDVGQAINDTVALRVTGLVEDSEGYQRNATLKRSGINPTVAIRPSKDTNIVLGFEHFEDKRAADRGVPSLNGVPMDLPVDAFFGDASPDSRPTRLNSNAFSAAIDHDFGGGVHLSNKTRYTDYDKFYQNYNAGAVNVKAGTVPISAYNNHQWRKNLFNQTDLTFDLDTGSVKHKILTGLELGKQDTDYLRMTGLFSNNTASINVPLASPDGSLPVNYVLGGGSADRDGNSTAKIAGVYIQDQIELTPQWQLIAGLRYDSFKLDYHNNVAAGLRAIPASAADLSSKDNLVSPRLGLMYKPMQAATIYANYSVASFPRGGDQLSSLTSINQGLKPEKFINYEIGGKLEVAPDLLATLAVYRLNRNNVAVVNPATGIADRLVDGQRTNGVEIGINGKITKAWSINGGYAHQDAKLLETASTTALNGAIVGMVPKNTLSLWNRYDFTQAVGAGLGLIRRDDMFASTSNTVVLPSYTRVDAALFYTINANYKLQVNVENLTDKKYYLYANGDNNITPGSPRAYRVSLHANF